jgi:hypothetical protein
LIHFAQAAMGNAASPVETMLICATAGGSNATEYYRLVAICPKAVRRVGSGEVRRSAGKLVQIGERIDAQPLTVGGQAQFNAFDWDSEVSSVGVVALSSPLCDSRSRMYALSLLPASCRSLSETML